VVVSIAGETVEREEVDEIYTLLLQHARRSFKKLGLADVTPPMFIEVRTRPSPRRRVPCVRACVRACVPCVVGVFDTRWYVCAQMVMKVAPRWHIEESGLLLHSLFVLATRTYQNDEDLCACPPLSSPTRSFVR
jgi:hypothetical protein